jgi:hypothetical protein
MSMRVAVAGLFFVNGFVVATWIPYIPIVKSRQACAFVAIRAHVASETACDGSATPADDGRVEVEALEGRV